jgi:hypothetical protein
VPVVLLHRAGTSRRDKIVEAVVVRFTTHRVLDLGCGFGGSTNRKLSDSLSSLTAGSDCSLLGEADSECFGDAGDQKKRGKLRRRNNHVLIRVPYGINPCSGDHPEGAGLLQGEGRV